MLNLIKVELKDKIIRIVPILLLTISMIEGYRIAYLDGLYDDTILSGGNFVQTFYVLLFILMFACSIFYVNDFKTGVIRNKMIGGHSRSEVFFSKFITITIYCMVVFLVFVISLVVSHIATLGLTLTDKLFCLYLLIVYAGVSIFISGVTAFICMLVRKTYVIFVSAGVSLAIIPIIEFSVSPIYEVYLMPIDEFIDSFITLGIIGMIFCLCGYLAFNNANVN